VIENRRSRRYATAACERRSAHFAPAQFRALAEPISSEERHDTPIERLSRLTAHLGGDVEIFAKREDCNSGLAFGGNKLRKLAYIVPDAIASNADTLVSIGGVHQVVISGRGQVFRRWYRRPSRRSRLCSEAQYRVR
jgi:hypothetical protein